MLITPNALGKANVATSTLSRWVAGLLLGSAIHGFVGADEADPSVKKPVADNTKEAIVTLPTVEVKTEKRTAGYRAETTTVGTKTDTPLIETPQSISIITQEQLQDQRADSLGTALRYTPGVQGETFGFNPRATSLKIRGFDSITTGLFRDGLQLRTPTPSGESFNPEPYGAERIEVLRGPASVLYGQSSPGGLVNFVTKRPPRQAMREIQFLAGNFSRYDGRWDLGGPIDERATFSYRLTGLVRNSGTQVDFINDNRIYIAPALAWRPSERTSLTLLSQFQDEKLGDFQFLPSEGTVLANPNGRLPARRFTGEPGFDKLNRREYAIGYLFEHQLNDAWTLRQNFRYSNNALDRAVVYSAGLQADKRTLNRVAFGNDQQLNTVALDNQAQVKFATGSIGHTVLLGVDYQHFDARSVTTFGNAPSIDIYRPVYGAAVLPPPVIGHNDTVVSQIGVYLQDQIKIHDKWVLSLAGRHDWASTELKNNVRGMRTEQNDSRFTGRAGLVYLSETGLTPYVSYSQSFLPTAGVNLFGQSFSPETAQQYEAGVKFQPTGWNSFITLAAFDLQRQNVRTPDPNNPLNQVQTGEVRVRGVEVEGVANFDFGLNLIASYTYLDAEITKSNVAGEKGERPTQVPEHFASIWGNYTLQKGLLRGLGLGTGVRYTGASYANAPNSFKSPAYTVVDAVIHYDWRQYRFAVNGSNLFNEEAFVCFSGGSFCSFGAQRTVIGSIRYLW